MKIAVSYVCVYSFNR